MLIDSAAHIVIVAPVGYQVTMRQNALWTLGLCLLFVQVHASTHPPKPAVNCIRTLTCQFEENACGFQDSVNWRREHSSSGYYQRYEYVDGTATDLVSPPLCNSAVDVQFSCLIITSDAAGPPAELHVLTKCDKNTTGASFAVPANKNLSSTWRNVTLTLPACSTGQSLNVVFRAVNGLPGSLLLLDNVLIEPESKQPMGRCLDKLFCQFEDNTCGFLDSDNWKLEHGSSGYYQRYKYTDGTTRDLVSPQLCNSAIDVHFSSLIITSNATGLPAQLHVLRECDDNIEGAAFVVPTNQNLSSAWKNVSVTLPACPAGQSPSVVFRAVYALPGSVIKLDNIRLETVHVTTMLWKPATTATSSSSPSESGRQKSTHPSVIITSTLRPSPTRRPLLTTFSPLKRTSTLPFAPESTRSSVAASTQTKTTAAFRKTTTVHQKTTTSSSGLKTTFSHNSITASKSVTMPARDSFSLSSQQSSLLTSLLVTTSPRSSDDIASTHSSATHLVRSSSSERPLLGSSSMYSSVTSQRLPPVSSTQHPPVSHLFTAKTQAPKSFSISSVVTTEDVSSTLSTKQNSSSNHLTTHSSDTDSATVKSRPQKSNTGLIVGVTVGVCITILSLVVIIIVIRRVHLVIHKEDRENLIKLKQRLARAELIY